MSTVKLTFCSSVHTDFLISIEIMRFIRMKQWQLPLTLVIERKSSAQF